jgi:hypothetical protein
LKDGRNLEQKFSTSPAFLTNWGKNLIWKLKVEIILK